MYLNIFYSFSLICVVYSFNDFYCSENCNKLLKTYANHTFEVDTCLENEYCNMIEKRCVSTHLTPGTCVPLKGDPFETSFNHCVDIPHATDCTKFYRCVAEWKKMQCNSGRFSKETLKCANIKYCEFLMGNRPPCTANNIGQKWTADSRLGCTVYFECSIRHELRACPQGNSFNPQKEYCDLDLNSEICKKGITKICNQTELFKAEKLEINQNLFSICYKNKVRNSLFYLHSIQKLFDITNLYNTLMSACQSVSLSITLRMCNFP